MSASLESLRRSAERWAPYGPPVIVFNKSHSGSRVLARLLREAGVFMGDDRNDSEDSADILRLVEPLVERWYPDYGRLLREGEDELSPLIDSVFAHHLATCPPGARWGWKLCETLYILPVLIRLFPDAWFVHLIRDGRDVAFSDHVAPVTPFWRKVYFDTADIAAWRGLPLTHRAYQRAPHVFNAQHWVNSVTVARHYGAMIGPRYVEVRYEDLVHDPEPTGRNLLEAVGVPPTEGGLQAFAASVRREKVGKHRARPPGQLRQALEVLRPTLTALGYDDTPATPQPGWRRRLRGL
jgi:LPS sulfotransferase NodH